jgi:hypothetical protein
MMATASRTRRPSPRSPEIETAAGAASGRIPLVHSRHAVSASSATRARGAAGGPVPSSQLRGVRVSTQQPPASPAIPAHVVSNGIADRSRAVWLIRPRISSGRCSPLAPRRPARRRSTSCSATGSSARRASTACRRCFWTARSTWRRRSPLSRSCSRRRSPRDRAPRRELSGGHCCGRRTRQSWRRFVATSRGRGRTEMRRRSYGRFSASAGTPPAMPACTLGWGQASRSLLNRSASIREP